MGYSNVNLFPCSEGRVGLDVLYFPITLSMYVSCFEFNKARSEYPYTFIICRLLAFLYTDLGRNTLIKRGIDCILIY